MFLKISNCGRLNRNFLKLMGFTTKRDLPGDNRTIGVFGSGTKAAAVAALRLGYGLVITSHDHLSSYRLSFDWQEVNLGGGETTKQIRFLYRTCDEDGNEGHYEEFWDMTLDAFKDWDQPIGSDGAEAFKVLREFICNAFDEDPEFRIDWVEDDEIDFAPEGMTHVFIRQTDDVQLAFDGIERYFKFLASDLEPLLEVPDVGCIYPKSEEDVSRLFVRGVLISCTNDSWNSTLYDYDLDDKDLISEDRTVKNIYDYKMKLGALLAEIADEEIITKMLRAMFAVEGAKIEDSALVYIYRMHDKIRAVWLRALINMYGTELLCVASGNRITDQDANQIYGYTVLGGSFSLKSFLKGVLGLPSADKIAVPQPKYSLLRFEDLDRRSQANFMLAFRAFAFGFPDRTAIPIVFFLFDDERVRQRINGVAGMGDDIMNEIWISALSSHELRSPMCLLRCLIHESRHVRTGVDDYNRVFVEAAEDDILRLLMSALQRNYDLDGNPVVAVGKSEEIRPNIVRPIIFCDDEGIEILGFDSDDDIGPAGAADSCFEELLRLERELFDKRKK